MQTYRKPGPRSLRAGLVAALAAPLLQAADTSAALAQDHTCDRMNTGRELA